MAYDFTTRIDRRGTYSLKWDNILPGDGDAIPLWVADMDFAPPPATLKALRERAEHPVYGYTNLPAAYLDAVVDWNTKRYGRSWDTSRFLPAPSVLHAMSMAVRTFTQPGDRLLNLPPVYYPFFKLAKLNDRENLEVPLVRRDRWEMDFDAIDAALIQSKRESKPVKAILFSAPQNPTGRVWTKDELTTLGDLAKRHDVLIFSDEIHADLILPGHRHIGPLDLPALADRTIVFAGPNKTFNLAGLPISHVAVLDDGLRSRMKRAIEADFYDQPNVLSLAAAWASYREGAAWVNELIAVIAEHKAVLDTWLAELNTEWKLEPALTSAPLEGTYLAWVDATGLIRKTGFTDDKALGAFLETNARVKLTTGSTFQTGGENHMRFNLATPRSLLEEGLARIKTALKSRL
jgi:cystathionine beta-lyase